MKVGKPKSKRVPVRLRHKIEKASAAKQRKQRKEAKKNPQWRSRLKKDPGIPNLFPYKDKVLAEIEESKRKREEETLRRRELAKAQRQGLAVVEGGAGAGPEVDDEIADEDLLDLEDEESDDDERMDEDAKNPMAALLASAQARAQNFRKDAAADDDEQSDEEPSGAEDTEWQGINTPKPRTTKPSKATTATTAPARKTLPQRALDDPIKAVTLLLDRLRQSTTSSPSSDEDGIQPLLDHYQIPPLVTAGSDTATRFLVEVARKRGRLGRGGVPNLPAAALTVLGDILEERLRLPSTAGTAVTTTTTTTTIPVAGGGAVGKSQIVTRMAEPFRIEGLFGDEGGAGTEMEVET